MTELSRIRVNADGEIASPGVQAATAFDRAFDEAIVLASAEMLGVAQAALSMALAYMRNEPACISNARSCSPAGLGTRQPNAAALRSAAALLLRYSSKG